MTNVTLAIIYLIPIFLVILVVLWFVLARTRRDLSQLTNDISHLSNDLAQLAAILKQPPVSQPPGDELGKVRENIEQLLDVLEERSSTAEGQLRQLIDEAREAAKQIDEATAAAVKTLDAAAESRASAATAAPEEAVAPLEAIEPPQAAPAYAFIAPEPMEVPPAAPVQMVADEPLPTPQTVLASEPLPPWNEEEADWEPPSPAVTAAESSKALQDDAIEEDEVEEDAVEEDALLEPLGPEPVPHPVATEKLVPQPAPAPVVDVVNDPLSAWAPYKPPSRPVPSPVEPPPAETIVNGHVETAAEPVDREEVESFEGSEVFAKTESEREEIGEAPDFQPFSIKPAMEAAEPSIEPVEKPGPAEAVIAATPIQAHVYASELKRENEEDTAHSNGLPLREGIAGVAGAHVEDPLTGQSVDPYSAVYTLAELGVTDVSEIARRTGLGQTEVEMVLNLWRRH